MKNKALFSIIAAMSLSSVSLAEFKVKVFLEENTMKFEIPNTINGDSILTPSTINRGETSMLSWNYDYLSELKISGDTDFNSGSMNGSIPLSPLKTSNYQVTVDNGKVQYTKDLKLTVIQPDPTLTFNSDKLKIGEGQSVNLSWATTNTEDAILNNGIGSVLLNSSMLVYPTDDTTYTLKAIGYNKEKEISKSLSIDVVKNSNINSFTVNKNKFTVGESAIFSWSVNDSENLVLDPYGTLNKTATSQSVPLSNVGSFDYTLKTTSFNGSEKTSTLPINVYGVPLINSYTVNDLKTINVESGDDLIFKWSENNADTIKLDNVLVTGTSTTLKAPATTKNYILEVQNGAGKKVQDNVAVNIVSPVAINSLTSPATVFSNSPFVMNWTGSSVEKYELFGTTGSGVGTSEDLAKAVTKTITPTAAGSYSYTLKATNLANKSVEQTKSVVVESDPTFTGFTVNGESSISVSPSATLTFAAVGASNGAILQGRNSGNTANSALPATSSSTAGSTTYYASVGKTLNNVSKYSSLRSVVVTVVNAPSIGTVTAPTNVFSNNAFTMSWSGTNVTNYKIKSNNAASGVAVSDVDLGTATSRSVTPTTAGTYIYTITATNAAGVTTTSTKTVIVEADPTFTGFTVNGLNSITVAPSTTLAYAISGNSSGSALVGRNSANTSNISNPTTASTAGSYTYYGAVSKTLNSVTRYSAVRSVAVTVVNNPTVSAITSPTNVFANAAFTMNWSGANVNSYSIKSNNASSGIATTDVALGTATSRSITPTAAGTYSYTITGTNAAGVNATSTISVVVEADPIYTGFTVNGSANISVAPSAALTFTGSGYSTGATLTGRNSANSAVATLPTTASASAGTTTYYAAATKTLNGVVRYSAVRSVAITVVSAPVISAVTSPSNVFTSAAFTMSWTASGASNYKIRSNNAASGIATTDLDLGTVTSRAITPTTAGTYTYTITATNSVGVTTISTKSVVVEANPTFTALTVNGSTSLSISPSTAVSFVGGGFSSGATLVGRNSANSANATLPTVSNAAVGGTTYYAAATKTLNGVVRYSAVRSAVVTVVANPTISSVTAPTNVFASAAFNMSWSATGATSYSIRSNNASSGIATTDVALGTATSRAITPTAAGTFTYTITATNSLGKTVTSTKSVIVEANPTFTGFTVNGSTNLSIAQSTAISFVGAGFSSGSTLVGRNSANSANSTLPTSSIATVGSTTYYAAATKTLNGVARYSAVRSVVVTTVSPKVCQVKNASYAWFHGQIGPQPSQIGTRITWAGTIVYSQMGGIITTVDVGGYRYTSEGTSICRTPL